MLVRLGTDSTVFKCTVPQVNRQTLGRTQGIPMRISFCLCIMSFLISGCSSTVELSSAVDANRKIGEGSATVYLKSGQAYDGREVDVRADSTQFIDRTTEDILRFPTGHIESIQVTHHGGGAIEGLLIGGLGGGALGLAAASGISTNEGGRGGAIFINLVAGGVGGLVYGAVKGHDYTFVFPDDSITVETGVPMTDIKSPSQKFK